MDNFKALSLVLVGMVIGLGYAVACGDGNDSASMPAFPGVGDAMAQSGCAQYEVRRFPADTTITADTGYIIEAGWTPIGVYAGGTWAARCAQ